MSAINILSLNCQGIGRLPKRTDMFQYLKEKKYHIYCLQDTHFTPGDDEKLVRARWGNDCYFSSFRSNSRGVAVLFNGNLQYWTGGKTKFLLSARICLGRTGNIFSAIGEILPKLGNPPQLIHNSRRISSRRFRGELASFVIANLGVFFLYTWCVVICVRVFTQYIILVDVSVE